MIKDNLNLIPILHLQHRQKDHFYLRIKLKWIFRIDFHYLTFK